jgi:hypothetical protein
LQTNSDYKLVYEVPCFLFIVPSIDEPLKNVVQEFSGRQLRGQHLQQEEVGVDHGLAEVALDVRHGLPFDLEAVTDPEACHDLVERRLK